MDSVHLSLINLLLINNLHCHRQNNHDRIVMENDATKQAVAARVSTDKAAFYSFSFISVQDTLWDDTGRHLYQSCYIEGSMDYIFGVGQSHFEVHIHSLIYKLETGLQ